MKVADMHCDTILAIQRGREQGKEISLRKNNLNVDLERMKKGDYLIQNFAIFLDLEDQNNWTRWGKPSQQAH